ncbi:MAG: hypothetical protein ACTHQQ_12840 [Solirubrobacteraceae bacterium]
MTWDWCRNYYKSRSLARERGSYTLGVPGETDTRYGTAQLVHRRMPRRSDGRSMMRLTKRNKSKNPTRWSEFWDRVNDKPRPKAEHHVGGLMAPTPPTDYFTRSRTDQCVIAAKIGCHDAADWLWKEAVNV